MSPTAAFENKQFKRGSDKFEVLIGGDSPLKEKKLFQAYHLKTTTILFT